MAKTKPHSPAPSADPPPEDPVAADALTELLRASAARTEQALGVAPGETSEFESMTTRGLTQPAHPAGSPEARAASAQRLGSNPRDAIERRLRRMGYGTDKVKEVVGETTRAISGFESSAEGAELPLGLERISRAAACAPWR